MAGLGAELQGRLVMKKIFAVPLVCAALVAGCASSAQMRHVEDKSSANQKALRETDQRLHTLEQSVAVLDSQVAQLRNRTFEVRTRDGKKTGMTVKPILPPAASVPAASAAPGAAGSPGQTAQPVREQHVALNEHGPQVTAVSGTAVVHPAPGVTAGASGAASPGAGEKNASTLSGASSAVPAASATSAASATGSAPATAAAEAPKGKIIDPAAPVRPFPSAAPAPQTSEAAHASGQGAAAGPSGKVGGTARKQAVPGNAETAPLGLPPVAAPEPSTPPAVDPVNFAAPNAGQAVVPATGGKENSAGGAAAVPVPQLPPSTLALPPEHPGLPPVEAPAANAGAAASSAGSAVSAAGSQTGSPAGSASAPRQADSRQGVSAAPAKTAAPGGAQAPARAAKGEKAAYDAALKVVMAGRSAEGISRFEAFLQEYPQGSYAPNAEYWIGEGLYAQGKYREALEQFRKVDASYPQHHKNADALLKTGMCLSRLGDREAAGQAYSQLLARFPKSEAARLARSRGLAR